MHHCAVENDFGAKAVCQSSSGRRLERRGRVCETVFYRRLPACDGWAYDFGCLVAYDVSSRAYLRAAWESVASKPLFWDHANVFVMIVTRSGKIDEHGDGSLVTQSTTSGDLATLHACIE